MRKTLSINLEDSSFDLWYVVKGIQQRATFSMDDEKRLSGTITTRTYEYVEDKFICVALSVEQLTAESCKESWRGVAVCWAIHGVWGLPSEYKGEE